MSPRREHPRPLALGVIAVATGAALFAAYALADVTVYKNSFKTKGQYKQVEMINKSKTCGRKWLNGRERMQVRAKKGPASCNFKLPIQGSSERPDHRLEAQARLMKETPAVVRRDAYLLLALRVGSGARYEFQVDSRDRTFKLLRKPGGAMFPVKGNSSAIRGLGKANNMRLLVEGGRVVANVNKTKVADVVDPAPGQVDGAKVYFGVGNKRKTGKDTVANFDEMKLLVPTP